MKLSKSKSPPNKLDENVKHYEGPREKSDFNNSYQLHSVPDGVHRYDSEKHVESDHKTSKFLR